jgi:DNA-binding LacI/PurR family transcriptional regulator
VTTIYDVARRANVSVATVSRVLGDNPTVQAQLRERVLEAAKELGYRPNRVARSLRVQKSSTIGLIISDIQNPFFLSVVRAVEDIAYDNSYSIFLCNSDEDPEKEKLYLNLMRDENVAGVILTPAREKRTELDRELGDDIPVVTLDRRLVGSSLDSVLTNNLESAFELVNHLIASGHQSIGAILGVSDITTGRERREGYIQALASNGIAFSADYVVEVIPKAENGYNAAKQLMSLPTPPSAIFIGNGQLTLGALQAIHEQNLVIPDDIAVACFDEMPWNVLVQPGITAVAQPTYELGRVAAMLLLERIENPALPVREVILKNTLIIRQSSSYRAK